jgi:hypothetical protein
LADQLRNAQQGETIMVVTAKPTCKRPRPTRAHAKVNEPLSL